METQELMIALQAYTISLDNMWNFMFTVALAAIGFLATLSQVIDPESRGQRRYRATVRTVRIGLTAFLGYGVFNMQGAYGRLNEVLIAIRDSIDPADEALRGAFAPYVISEEALGRACVLAEDPVCVLSQQSPSLYGFAAAALFIVLMVPWFAGATPGQIERDAG